MARPKHSSFKKRKRKSKSDLLYIREPKKEVKEKDSPKAILQSPRYLNFSDYSSDSLKKWKKQKKN